MRLVKWLILSLIFLPGSLFAQEVENHGDPDISYYRGRELAFAGSYQEARDTLQKVLANYPEYTDVEILLAKVYSWSGDHDQARRHLNRITSKERGLKEAWLAAIQNEIYAGNPSLALGLANKASVYIEKDGELESLKKKIWGLIEEGSSSNDKRPIAQNENLSGSNAWKNYVSVYTQGQIFDQTFDPMYNGGIEYNWQGKWGRIIPKINYAYRFEEPGVQLEIAAYPIFSKRLRAYIDYGYSTATIFPEQKASGDMFYKISPSLEASIGLRYLQFPDDPVLVFTGSVGWYNGDYYLNLRPFITPNTGKPPAFSGNLMVRRYLRNARNFLTLRLGAGVTPEIQLLSSGETLLAESLLFAGSQEMQLEYQFTPGNGRIAYNPLLGLARREFVVDAGNFYWAFTAGFRLTSAF